MSGTSLVLLAMYSTVNVVGPAGHQLSPDRFPVVLSLLMTAAVLTCAAMFALTSTPRRRAPRGAFQAKPLRRLNGPRDRRR